MTGVSIPMRNTGPSGPFQGGPTQASGRLAALAAGLDADKVSLGELVDRLGHAGFGFVLLLLTVIVMIPVPGPLGMFLGLIIIFIALQLLIGARRLWLPGWLRRRQLPAPMLRSMIDRLLPHLRRLETWLHPRRWTSLTGFGARSMLAAPLVLLGGAITLPIPLGNFMPAIALFVVSLGLIVRDGAAVIAGLVLTIVALGWTAALVFAGAEIFQFLFGWTGWFG